MQRSTRPLCNSQAGKPSWSHRIGSHGSLCEIQRLKGTNQSFCKKSHKLSENLESKEFVLLFLQPKLNKSIFQSPSAPPVHCPKAAQTFLAGTGPPVLRSNIFPNLTSWNQKSWGKWWYPWDGTLNNQPIPSQGYQHFPYEKKMIPKTNSSPLKIDGFHFRNLFFQGSIFRGKLHKVFANYIFFLAVFLNMKIFKP